VDGVNRSGERVVIPLAGPDSGRGEEHESQTKPPGRARRVPPPQPPIPSVHPDAARRIPWQAGSPALLLAARPSRAPRQTRQIRLTMTRDRRVPHVSPPSVAKDVRTLALPLRLAPKATSPPIFSPIKPEASAARFLEPKTALGLKWRYDALLPVVVFHRLQGKNNSHEAGRAFRCGIAAPVTGGEEEAAASHHAGRGEEGEGEEGVAGGARRCGRGRRVAAVRHPHRVPVPPAVPAAAGGRARRLRLRLLGGAAAAAVLRRRVPPPARARRAGHAGGVVAVLAPGARRRTRAPLLLNVRARQDQLVSPASLISTPARPLRLRPCTVAMRTFSPSIGGRLCRGSGRRGNRVEN
jgi:hypothetical protein